MFRSLYVARRIFCLFIKYHYLHIVEAQIVVSSYLNLNILDVNWINLFSSWMCVKYLLLDVRQSSNLKPLTYKSYHNWSVEMLYAWKIIHQCWQLKLLRKIKPLITNHCFSILGWVQISCPDKCQRTILVNN